MRPLPAPDFRHQQPDPAQNRKVVRDAGLRHVHGTADLAHRLLLPQEGQEFHPHRIGNRRQEGSAIRGERRSGFCATIDRRLRHRSIHSVVGERVRRELLVWARACQAGQARGPDSRIMTPRTLTDMNPEQLVAFAIEHGQPAYRGRQLAEALYEHNLLDLYAATALPRSLRESWSDSPGIAPMRVSEAQTSTDGTTKYLLELVDGARIEAVAMPRDDGNFTYCLSSQVGCRMACVFCATGRMGIIRQLRPAEIVEQVRLLARLHPGKSKPNLVFMGMGEPFDNLDALLPALDIFTHEQGMAIGARRITVSTSGLVEGIARLREFGRPIGLAVSLTTGNAEERRRLMPVAGQVPLSELLEAAAAYGREFHRKVTLECAIIAGENDRPEDALRLRDLARSGPFKVNLIPLNPIEDFGGQRPAAENIGAMVDLLWQSGIVATVRDSRGRQVEGACGQLVHRQRRQAGAPRSRVIDR